MNFFMKMHRAYYLVALLYTLSAQAPKKIFEHLETTEHGRSITIACYKHAESGGSPQLRFTASDASTHSKKLAGRIISNAAGDIRSGTGYVMNGLDQGIPALKAIDAHCKQKRIMELIKLALNMVPTFRNT